MIDLEGTQETLVLALAGRSYLLSLFSAIDKVLVTESVRIAIIIKHFLCSGLAKSFYFFMI